MVVNASRSSTGDQRTTEPNSGFLEAVGAERGLQPQPVPPPCVLDFDGDLSDYLPERHISSPWKSWACFHTSMAVATIAGIPCLIIGRR